MGWSTYQPQVVIRMLAINRMSRNLVFCLIFFNDGSFSGLEIHGHACSPRPLITVKPSTLLDVTLRMKKLWICVKSQKIQVCKWWHRPLFFGTCYIWIYIFIPASRESKSSHFYQLLLAMPPTNCESQIWRALEISFGWWFQICFIFTPIWGNDPIWLIFFKWLETTN